MFRIKVELYTIECWSSDYLDVKWGTFAYVILHTLFSIRMLMLALVHLSTKRDREVKKNCRKGKKWLRGNLHFDKFSYFENTNFRPKWAFWVELRYLHHTNLHNFEIFNFHGLWHTCTTNWSLKHVCIKSLFNETPWIYHALFGKWLRFSLQIAFHVLFLNLLNLLINVNNVMDLDRSPRLWSTCMPFRV